MNETTPRNRGRRASLGVSYVVKNKDQVDDLKSRFDLFLKRCDILDRGKGSNEVPVILSQDAESKSLSVNLDASCEVVIRDMAEVQKVAYSIGDILITFKDTVVRVRVGVMGPEDA
mgnify:CR=1 FL=1